MYTTPPAGFGQLPFGHSNQQLLLPTALIKQLAETAQESEDRLPAFETESLLQSLLMEEGMTPQQLHQDFLAFKKYQKNQPPPQAFNFKNSHFQYRKIFDIASIHARKSDSSVSRNMQTVMKRFKANDDGERELRPVPEHFMADMQHLKTQYPNCIHFLEYVESFATLAMKQRYPTFYFPPVLLVGPPGIGKTAVVNAVADLVGVTSRQVDLAATTAGMVLGGMSTQWADAKTGVIIDLLRDGQAANPIVILDELDKAASDAKFNPLGPLYNLLEQKTATKFIDEALDLPTDASHVLYVATANTLETITKPILSRFIVIEIEAITAEQHRHVTQSIYQSLLQHHDCQALFPKKLSLPVVEALRQHSPRVIKGALRRALAQAAQRNRTGKKLVVTEADLLFSSVTPVKNGHYQRRTPIGFIP